MTLFYLIPVLLVQDNQIIEKKKFCLQDTHFEVLANQTAYLMVHQVSTYSGTQVEGSLKIIFFLGGKEIMTNFKNIHELEPNYFLYFGDPDPQKKIRWK